MSAPSFFGGDGVLRWSASLVSFIVRTPSRQAPAHAFSRNLWLTCFWPMDALGEQSPGSQCLERVAAPQLVHHPDQAIQALRLGVGDWLLEVVEDEGL